MGKATQALADAGLDFNVFKKELYTYNDMTDRHTSVGSHRAIVRTDTDEVLGVVGSTFGCVSHKRALGSSLDVILPSLEKTYGPATVKACALEVKRRGLGGQVSGSKAMVEILFPEAPSQHAGPGGTRLCPNLTAFNGLAGESAVKFEGGIYSTVCLNGMIVGEKEFSKAVRHTAKVAMRLEIAEHLVERSMHKLGDLSSMLHQSTHYAIDHPSEVLRYVLTGDAKAGEREARGMSKMIDSYHDAPGSDPGTVYGVVQAATHYATHVQGKGNGFSSHSTSARLIRVRALELASRTTELGSVRLALAEVGV